MIFQAFLAFSDNDRNEYANTILRYSSGLTKTILESPCVDNGGKGSKKVLEEYQKKNTQNQGRNQNDRGQRQNSQGYNDHRNGRGRPYDQGRGRGGDRHDDRRGNDHGRGNRNWKNQQNGRNDGQGKIILLSNGW